MKQKKSYPANYLDFVPLANPQYSWEQTSDGMVAVKVARTGFYDKLAQRVFHKPASSRVALDELGSFIWLQIDGQRSIYDIALTVRERFGERAEPLLRRLITFFKMLESYRFVCFQGRQAAAPCKDPEKLRRIMR